MREADYDADGGGAKLRSIYWHLQPVQTSKFLRSSPEEVQHDEAVLRADHVQLGSD